VVTGVGWCRFGIMLLAGGRAEEAEQHGEDALVGVFLEVVPGSVGRLAEAFQVVVAGFLPACTFPAVADVPGAARGRGREAAGPGVPDGLSRRPSGRLDRRSR
jgi:hypothetical protein